MRPAARQLSPTLINLDALAPDLRGLFNDLGPLVRVSRKGLPATEQVLDNTRPILARLPSFLRQLTPVVDYLGLYKSEITSLLGNDAAATQAVDVGFNNSSQQVHYLRTANPTNPEMIAGWPFRLNTNRSNPYTEPGGYRKLASEGHLEVFGSYLCTTNPWTPPPTANQFMNQITSDLVAEFVFGVPENVNKAPPCDPQTPLGRLAGQDGQLFPHLQPLP